jgi:ubiquinone/menaquinone biosynthesis C-methylase UbiE
VHLLPLNRKLKEVAMTLPDYANKQPSFPQMYERLLVEPLFRPWAETLLDRAGLTAGDRVIDLACGTGIVSRIARSRTDGKIVGVDLSPLMLEVARSVAPDIDWREGNASALPVDENEKFDLLVCQQGLQFFPEKPQSALEMHRVLAKGGKAVVATWRPIEEMPLFYELLRIAESHLGPIADQRHSFGDSAALKVLLEEAGFHDVNVETVCKTTRFDDGNIFIRMNAIALTGMSPTAKAMPDEERTKVIEAIIAASSEARDRFSDGAALSFEMSSNVATAHA